MFVLWAINSLVDLVVSFIPSSQAPQSISAPINPAPAASGQSRSAETIDVSSILGADVFGPVAANEVQSLAEETAASNLETVLKMARVRRAWPEAHGHRCLHLRRSGECHDRSEKAAGALLGR